MARAGLIGMRQCPPSILEDLSWAGEVSVDGTGLRRPDSAEPGGNDHAKAAGRDSERNSGARSAAHRRADLPTVLHQRVTGARVPAIACSARIGGAPAPARGAGCHLVG